MPRYEFIEEVLSQGTATQAYRKLEKLEPDYNLGALQLRGSYNVNVTVLGAPVYKTAFHASDVMEELDLVMNRNIHLRTYDKLRDGRLYDQILSGGETPQTLPLIGASAVGDNLFTWTLNIPIGFYKNQVKAPSFGWIIRRLMTLLKIKLRFGIGTDIFATEPTAYTLVDNKVEVWGNEEPVIKYPGRGQKYTPRVELFDDEENSAAVVGERVKLQPYGRKAKGVLIVTEDDGDPSDLIVDTVKIEVNSNPILNETPWAQLQIDNKEMYSPQGVAITSGAVYYDFDPEGLLADVIDLDNPGVRSLNVILNKNAPVGALGRTKLYIIAKP